MTATSLKKGSDFPSRFGIDNPAKFGRAPRRVTKHAPIVGNHSDLQATYASVAGYDLFRIVRLELIQMSFIEQTIQELAHVVRLPMIFGNDFVESFFRSLRF